MCGKRNIKTWLVMWVFLVGMAGSSFAGRIIYVDGDANGLNDGSSWADAYNWLQDGLADANSGDEVWVAEGIYKPNQSSGKTPDCWEFTFQLMNGVTIKGGYAGFGQPDPNVRDIDLYETILSGDIYGNDVDVNSPEDLLFEPTRFDNSYRIVTGSGTDETAIIDGLTITGGHYSAVPAVFSYNPGGGSGMYNESGSPTVMNCTFSGNCSIEFGGAMLNWSGSSPTLVNCIFTGNWASSGGGVCNRDNSSPTLVNCVFSGNSADSGGGMFNWKSSPRLSNCILWDNTDWGGSDESAQIHWGTPVVNYCCIQGWTGSLGGTGNINADPLFVDADNGDYHLKSAGWRWDRQRKVWTWDEITSPCIDAGNPGSPLGEELLFVPDDPENEWGENLRINMGASGGTAEASMAPPGWPLLADLNNDAIVNFVDFARQVQDWLMTEGEQPGDLNRDRMVNKTDLAILAEDWLKHKSFAVNITKPEDGTIFEEWETIEIEADAWCAVGSVVKVEFFANGIKIGEDSDGSDGWNTSWEGTHTMRVYNLSAKATHSNGTTAISPAVRIMIYGGP